MAKPLTAPARLALLLPWLNGDPLTADAARDCVSSFFAATARAWGGTAGGEIAIIYGPRKKGSPWLKERLDRFREDLAARLDRAMPPAPRRLDLRELPSLRWDIGRAMPSDTKLSALSARQRRARLGPGAYRMVVRGELEDIVTYCLMRTLTEPGAVTLARCPAPVPNDWSRRCGRWLVAIGKRRGRPREYCSPACRVRYHAEEIDKKEAETLRRKRRAQRSK